jgi:glycosyltransferase involved in cell wall biosynthesis
MVKYLSQFGHKMTVLTHSYSRKDISQPGEIRIYDVSHNKDRTGFHKFTWSCLRGWTEFLNIFGKYHSIYSFWKQNVIKTAEEIISQVKPDAIIATYPPIEDLEIGLYFSKRYNIPLIADFRDGLLFESIEHHRMEKYKCIQTEYTKIEVTIAKRTSIIITAFPCLAEYFAKTYLHPNVYPIPNGCDVEEFDNLPQNIKLEPGKFHIVHTGRFGGSDAGCHIIPFLDALRRLITQYSAIKEKLRVHFVGQLEKREIQAMRDLIKQKIVRCYGLLERKTALAFQREADLLLVITPLHRKGIVPGKLFEYLYARRPILALTHQSYTENIVKTTKTGWTVHPEDKDEIYQLLYDIVESRASYRTFRPSDNEISKFSRFQQMTKLNRLLTTKIP